MEQLDAAAEVFGGDRSVPTGQFTFDLLTGSMICSEPLYRIRGFAPGEVVPTAELMSAHRHPMTAPGLPPRWPLLRSTESCSVAGTGFGTPPVAIDCWWSSAR